MPADLIIYAIVAAGLVFWLRGTLGTRQEGDEPATPPAPLGDIEAGALPSEAKTLPLAKDNTPHDQIEAISADKGGIIGIETDDAKEGLVNILEADKNFDLKFFFTAAQDVFVIVAEAFADGDRETLENMLKTPVYNAFEQAITDREAREEIAQTEIHSIAQAQIIEAHIDNKDAYITLRFVADQTSLTKDKDDKVIEGHAERTSRMTDIWTFTRNTKSRDPRWMVQETRGDFEGDNDIIPNA